MPLQHSDLGRIARADGTFAMVAMDQRESLRLMLAKASGRTPEEVADDELTAFKVDVAAVLAPEASGFLIDPEFGGPLLSAGASGAPPSGTGLVVAADRLTGRPGEVVADAAFDGTLDLEAYARQGVAAAKLLVVWRDDERNAERVRDAARFIAACRSAGLLSIVEGVIRPVHDPAREKRLIECAGELGALRPSLYKAEVPYFGRAEPERITAAAAELTDVLDGPWVVLSSHVERADFLPAVAACCRGGASGLLSGRALWTNALESTDRRRTLRAESVPFLHELSRTVSTYARPWPAATST